MSEGERVDKVKNKNNNIFILYKPYLHRKLIN